jgi:hypothetical protein
MVIGIIGNLLAWDLIDFSRHYNTLILKTTYRVWNAIIFCGLFFWAV